MRRANVDFHDLQQKCISFHDVRDPRTLTANGFCFSAHRSGSRGRWICAPWRGNFGICLGIDEFQAEPLRLSREEDAFVCRGLILCSTLHTRSSLHLLRLKITLPSLTVTSLEITRLTPHFRRNHVVPIKFNKSSETPEAVTDFHVVIHSSISV